MNSCIMKWTSSCVILKDDLSFKHNPSQFIFIIITYYPQYTYIVDPLLEAGQAIIVVRIPLDFRFILFIVLKPLNKAWKNTVHPSDSSP